MKECYWCKEQKPDDEEGSFELEPDTDEEVGWICDHCVLCFEGKCGCEQCQASDKAVKEALRKYDLALPRGKRSVQIGCILLSIPFLLMLILYIVDCLI